MRYFIYYSDYEYGCNASSADKFAADSITQQSYVYKSLHDKVFFRSLTTYRYLLTLTHFVMIMLSYKTKKRVPSFLFHFFLHTSTSEYSSHGNNK
jgi:hypothetical protein